MDRRFEPLNKFSIGVPYDYEHHTQIGRAVNRLVGAEGVNFVHENLIDDNFTKTTDRLVAGKPYEVLLFFVKSRASSEACVEFLLSQRALLVGAQGLLLVQSLASWQFPVDSWVHSLDVKANLFPAEVVSETGRGKKKTGFVYQTPFASCDKKGFWSFGTSDFVDDLGLLGHEEKDYILCVRELA